MGEIKTLKTNYVLPGQPMTEEEAKSMVQEAQQGKFHSMQDLKQKSLNGSNRNSPFSHQHHSQQSQSFQHQGNQKNQDLRCAEVVK